MMKTNYLFIGMAALMIAACSNNENEPQVDDGRIAVSFAGEITLPRATTDTWEAVTRNFAASLFRNIKYFTLRKLYLCRKWMQKRLQKTTTTGITLPNFDFLA